MDRIFVVDNLILPEFGSDGELIRYICEQYPRKFLDESIFTNKIPKEKTLVYKHRKYRIIPITSVQETEEYLKTVYNVSMPPIEVPPELIKYRPDYEVLQGKDIPKDKMNTMYFIKRVDKLKSWNSLLLEGDVGKYIEPDALYSISPRHTILSEWRIFIYQGEVMACQHYDGSPLEFPDVKTIESMIFDYKTNVPEAYTLDVAATRDIGKPCSTIPLEVHPFVSCGLYGFTDKIILDMWDAGLNWYINQKK